MISSLLLSPQDLSNFGTQLMQARNSSKTVLLVQNSLRLNSPALPSMRMVFATLEVPMVESTFGIKNKILD
jgi:hypothetical protein